MAVGKGAGVLAVVEEREGGELTGSHVSLRFSAVLNCSLAIEAIVGDPVLLTAATAQDPGLYALLSVFLTSPSPPLNSKDVR